MRTIFRALFIGVVLGSFGCSFEVPKDKGGGLVIHLEDKQHELAGDWPTLSSMKIGPFQDFTTLADPSTVSDFNCFAVNVTGEGIPANAIKLQGCTSPDNFTGRGVGIISEDAPRGQSVVLEVPSGRNRYIDVYGIYPSNCGNSTSGPSGSSGGGDDGAGYFLGRAIKDIGENTSVTIGIALTSSAIANKVTCPKDNNSGSYIHYILVAGNSLIRSWKLISSQGSFTDVGTTVSTNISKMQITSDSRWALALDTSTSLRAHSISSSTGIVNGATAVAWNTGTPSLLTISSGNSFVFGLSGTTIVGQTFNATTGSIGNAANSTAPSSVIDFTTSPTHMLGWATKSSEIHQYMIDTNSSGVWNDVGTTGLASAGKVRVYPKGTFLYVISGGTSINGYSINTSNAALTPISGSPWSVGGTVTDFAMDPDGRYLYVARADSNVEGWTINSSTGALTTISGGPWSTGGSGANGIAIAGTYVFVTESTSEDLIQFPMTNGNSGQLSAAITHPLGYPPTSIGVARFQQ